MKIIKFTFNGFQENTYLVHDEQVGIIIDPGCYDRSEEMQLFNQVESLGIEIVGVLLTHAHIDHMLGADAVCKKYGLPLHIHQLEVGTLNAVQGYAAIYGFPRFVQPEDNYIFVENDSELNFGTINIKVLFTPGHSVGHVVYYFKESNLVINGDVLFQGSFGRVDLPGGDLETLKHSIFNVMFNLPEDTVVYCGHGPETTIGTEKRFNYILQF